MDEDRGDLAEFEKKKRNLAFQFWHSIWPVAPSAIDNSRRGLVDLYVFSSFMTESLDEIIESYEWAKYKKNNNASSFENYSKVFSMQIYHSHCQIAIWSELS